MSVECRITTVDNPYDPFEQYDSWYSFDTDPVRANLVEYNSCGLLGRVARTSDQLSDEENDLEIERAIDEIISNDFLNVFRKVTR